MSYHYTLRKTLSCLGLGFVLLGGLQIGATSLQAQTTKSQEQLVSVSFKDKDIASILSFIAQRTGHTISDESGLSSSGLKATVSFDGVSLDKAVGELLKGTPFSYSISGTKIRVYKIQKSQGKLQISGVVKDSRGEALVGASVVLVGTTRGAMADIDGRFSLQVDNPQGELQVSYTGSVAQRVHYTVGKNLSIVLKDDSKQLGDVTVIAYGKRNTREVVGAVTSIKSEDLKDVPAPTVESLLQGRLAGVAVTNASGAPGGASSVVVRGYSSLNNTGVNNGSPLYVIDGVPVSNASSSTGVNPLASLDPSTIESVDVLKDAASAALYGSRSGNGVVLITTKKGKSGRADIGVNFSQSLSSLPEVAPQIMGNGERLFYLKLARARRAGTYDWRTGGVLMPSTYSEASFDLGGGGIYDYYWNNGERKRYTPFPRIAQDSLNTFYNNKTNWWDYIFRVGKTTKADVRVSGGNDNARYLISGGYYDETGILIASKFNRVSLLSNLDLKLSPKLNLHLRTNLAYTNQTATNSGQAAGLGIDPRTTSTLLPGRGTEIEYETLKQIREIDSRNSNYSIRLSGGLEYTILKGLKFTSTTSLDHYMNSTHVFTPKEVRWRDLNEIRSSRLGVTAIQSENLLNYTFSLGQDHNFDILAGVTYNQEMLSSIGGTAESTAPNQVKQIGSGWPTFRMVGSAYESLQRLSTNYEEQRMVSLLTRVSYNYKKRYLLDASIRSDGSSVFGSDVRWGTFPAVGLGWAFSEEKFMKPLWWLSFGKLRASLGRSGQKFQEAYLAQGVMAEGNVFLGNISYTPGEIVNTHLTWEKSTQFDLGLDLDLLNYRLHAKVDYYYKYSDALLMKVVLPGDVFFITSAWSNALAVSNEGIELDISADVIKNKDLTWNVGFNIARNNNMLRKTYDGADLEDKVLGRPIYGLYTFADEGIVQNEKDIPYSYNQQGVRTPLHFGSEVYPLRVGGRKIKDQNGDGVINFHDAYYAGSTIPLAFGGIYSTLTWKDFSASAVFNYTLGRKVMNLSRNGAYLFDGTYGAIFGDYTKESFWEKPGDETTYPSMEFSGSSYFGQYDGNIDSNIENVSYLRLRQLVLSYKLPDKWFKKTFLKSARVYLTGENLFLISNFSGVDPEVINEFTGRYTGAEYPLSRKFTFGFNLKF